MSSKPCGRGEARADQPHPPRARVHRVDEPRHRAARRAGRARSRRRCRTGASARRASSPTRIRLPARQHPDARALVAQRLARDRHARARLRAGRRPPARSSSSSARRSAARASAGGATARGPCRCRTAGRSAACCLKRARTGSPPCSRRTASGDGAVPPPASGSRGRRPRAPAAACARAASPPPRRSATRDRRRGRRQHHQERQHGRRAPAAAPATALEQRVGHQLLRRRFGDGSVSAPKTPSESTATTIRPISVSTSGPFVDQHVDRRERHRADEQQGHRSHRELRHVRPPTRSICCLLLRSDANSLMASSPNANPPMWAKYATPPPLAG